MPSAQAQTVMIPKRLPLVAQPDNRDNNSFKDARLINGYAEKNPQSGEYNVYKRLGLSTPQYLLKGNGRGMFQWVGSTKVTYVTSSVPVNVPGEAIDYTLTVGWDGATEYGYSNGAWGTLLGTLPTGQTITYFSDDHSVPNFGFYMEISGFTSDPTINFISSVVANGITLNGPSASYFYDIPAGIAGWLWTGTFLNLVLDAVVPVVVNLGATTQYIQIPIYTSNPLLVMIAGTGVSVLTQGTTPVLSTLGTILPGGICRFCQINAPTPLLMFGDGTVNAYYTDGTTITQITDPNYPQSTVPGIVVLDGTIYVMNTIGQIFGSQNLNDPTVWNPLNLIAATIEGDLGIFLAKQLTYVIALKQWTTEFFYDADTPPPSSPLLPVPAAMLNYGCLSAQTVQDFYGMLFWVTSSKISSPQVARLENMQFSLVSSPAVDRLLMGAGINAPFFSFVLHRGGHRFYGLTRVDTAVTMIYDIDQHLWYEWESATGSYWPIVGQANDIYGHLLLQDQASGAVYYTDTANIYPTDNGSLFPVDIYTPNYDGGVDREKMLSAMYFDADRVSGSTLQIRHSDDDYQTWTNFRQVDLNQKRPFIPDEGSFWRRAYHFRHRANTEFRIRTVGLQMDLGTI